MDNSIEQKIVLSILELAALLTKNGNEMSSKVGLTTQQWIILLYLNRDPNISGYKYKFEGGMLASELAEALNVSRPNITSLVNTLLTKGLVVQVEDVNDRRRKLLNLSEAGKRALETLQPFREQANIRLMEGFSQEDLAKFDVYIQKCLIRLNNLSSQR